MNTYPSVHTATAPTEGSTDSWRLSSSKAVHPSSRLGDESLVSAIASGLAAVAVPWELASGTAPDHRSYELLLSTEHYDAWLIYWPAGAGLDAHDHGGSGGAFAVVDGALEEDVIDEVGGTVTRRVGAGESVEFAGDHVHAVVNRGVASATSVHVYSPPLRTMGFYRPDVTGRLVVERVDNLDDARR